jgi:putative hydrolase of the HAD superfamily
MVFDLDDTLYKEITYLKSGYKKIAKELIPIIKMDIHEDMLNRYYSGENVFEWVVKRYSAGKKEISKDFLLKLYREHDPDITLNIETQRILEILAHRKISCGLITDGRSISQRNKLKTLGLIDYFKDVIISEEFGSEKPDKRNYLYFQDKYPEKKFVFIGDNTNKDFIVPAQLGWFTICLKDNGDNIHKQAFFDNPPNLIIDSLEDLIQFIN